MKKEKMIMLAVVTVIAIVVGLVAFDKWLSHKDKVRKKHAGKNTLYALKKVSLTDDQLNNYGSTGEFELYPYLMFKARPNFKSPTVNTNSFGFRGPEVFAKTKDIYRIVIVGASTAFGGMSTSDEKTFYKVLERNLNKNLSKDNRRYEVICGAMPSYNSMQELILIEMKILKMEPDMVIILDGFNDAINYLARDSRAGYPDMFKDLEKYTNTKAFFKMRLRKIRIIRKIMEHYEKKEAMSQKAFDPAVVEFYGDNLDIMCHLLKSYSIAPVLVTQPAIHYKQPLSQPENDYAKDDSLMSRKGFIELYDALAKAAQGVAIKNNVPYVDARYIYNGNNETLFTDDCHLNDRAQEMLAGALTKTVSEKIELQS